MMNYFYCSTVFYAYSMIIMLKHGSFQIPEITATVRNLQTFLPGSFLQKFFRLPEKKRNGTSRKFMFRFSRRPYRHFLFNVGVRAHLVPDSSYQDTYSTHIPRDGFMSKLKKHLNNAFVLNVHYTPGTKYFEIEFTYYILGFDFYSTGNVVLMDKDRRVIISWYQDPRKDVTCDIVPGTEYTKKAEVGECVESDGAGYVLHDKVYTEQVEGGIKYDVFGEAVYTVFDKQIKQIETVKRTKCLVKHKKGQIDKWESKVEMYTQGLEWIESNSYRSLDELRKTKITALPFASTVFKTIEVWRQKYNIARRKLQGAINFKNKQGKKKRVTMQPAKEEWFGKYHWFFTYPENILVIAGRNVSQNEEIVKKHLDARNLFFHSESRGSPCVILKCDSDPSPSSIEQAGAFAICHSKSWKTDVTDQPYYVRAHQVSKTAESGEYITKGSFMIRGVKTYLRNQDLVMGICVCDKRLVCAPESALRHVDRIKIKPGSTNKSRAIRQCRKIEKNIKFSEEVWQRVLPSGGIKIS